jgi:hypothetical protein
MNDQQKIEVLQAMLALTQVRLERLLKEHHQVLFELDLYKARYVLEEV